MWIVVYAPQNLAAKITLWSTLVNLIDNWDGISVTMGDFNKVREADERFGSCFNERQASSFNSFITNSSLIDVSLGGRLDHRPILLKEHVSDFGPTPFRFFHSWLELEGFHTLVVDTWKNDGIVHANDHSQRLAQIDVKIDQGCATDLDLLNRSKAIRILDDLNRLEAKDLAQKARIKWALDGDENSSFFHATLRKKRRQQAIKGILKDGEWIDDPNNIKTEFVDHFRKRFLQVSGHPSSLEGDMPNILSFDQYYMSLYKMPVAIYKQLESMQNQFFIGGDIRREKDGLGAVEFLHGAVVQLVGGILDFPFCENRLGMAFD
ncbi:hypothetical protein Tco_0847969 [Tanacetum coccineum]